MSRLEGNPGNNLIFTAPEQAIVTHITCLASQKKSLENDSIDITLLVIYIVALK